MKCEKCSEKFSEKLEHLIPRILTSCGHTICHQCCANLLENGQISCPIDGKITEIRVSGLPINLAILKVLKDSEDEKFENHDSGYQSTGSTSAAIFMPSESSESIFSIHSEYAYSNHHNSDDVESEATDTELPPTARSLSYEDGNSMMASEDIGNSGAQDSRIKMRIKLDLNVKFKNTGNSDRPRREDCRVS